MSVFLCCFFSERKNNGSVGEIKSILGKETGGKGKVVDERGEM